ncbi:LOW QUALITY PROTEIN: protein monoglycylase TTLL8-like [Rhopalosiphum maidis]|uniref:LOW QUALITY PROTEIN: protein monoglycylase TTLL8-like n=1 Tax=Rhopalosiphum maidis TaxID=43146 RepID=UPI000EFED643|nr:LOW QUALITY PROTEIN: protein monoglycylase TTLL8-like [Rhopalosiphum maidis]
MPMASNNQITLHCKNSVGTVDQAIRERKIFTAVAKMPAEIQMTLIKNGWIGKIKDDNNFRNSDGPTVILSLHNNVERVKTIVKRYESGLVWTDALSSGVNWMTLHPDVVINRFPRDANAALKLCGHTLAGKSEFDFHYPRAYRACADELHADRSFVSDYSLTACVSLLRAFVDGDHQAMCAKSGQAPLSALHFAATKCHKYLMGDGSLGASEFSGKGADWETFFEHYYMIVHDKKKFTVPGTGDDVDAALRYLAASSRLIVNQMTAARPQTAMDGYKNIWIVKDTAGHRRRPVMLNKIGDVLNRCARPGDAANRIVQKYIETPLLRNNVKSDVYTWIVLSTLGGRQTTWLHRTCVIQPYAHRFSLYQDSSRSGHFDRFKTGGLHGMLRSTALIFGLKQLGAKMRRGAKANKLLQQQRRVNEDDRTDGDNVYTAVKRSTVSAVTAAVASGSINLRPNCLELFRGTFVLGDDLRPWLIDIVADDPCLAADCEERDRLAAPAATRVIRSVVQGVAKMLVDSGRRGRATRFGMFDMVHECPLPVGAGSYVPRLFVAPKSTHRSRLSARTASRTDHPNAYLQQYWWNDDNIHTYVEMISAEDVQDKPLQQAPRWSVGLLTTMADNADLLAGSAKNRDLCNPNENRRYLKFLDKYKTKITSALRVYKTIIRRNCNNKKRYT